MELIHCIQAEWLKRRRSLASWLVIIGGFFTPVILIIVKLVHHDQLKEGNQQPKFWQQHWLNSWESMAIMLLPLGIILAVSLITQLEFKNNCWKQWHTTPQHFTTMYFAKLLVLIFMLFQLFFLLNIGIYLSAVLPGLFVRGVSYPAAEIPFLLFAKHNLVFFITCLPVVALQFLTGLQFKNFMVSLGSGIALWIASIASLTWKYSYTLPYSYSSLYFFNIAGRFKHQINFSYWSLGWFFIFTVAGYILYITKKEKG